MKIILMISAMEIQGVPPLRRGSSVALLPPGLISHNLDSILPHGRNCDYYDLSVLTCKIAVFLSYGPLDL